MNMMDYDHDQGNLYVEYPNDNAFNNRVFTIYMISFSLFLFFLFTLYLYVRCVLAHRSSRHRDTVRRLTFVALQARDAHNPQFFIEQPIGLDPALVASLPIFTVRTNVSDGENNSDASKAESCVVCLSALESEEKAKLLPNCNHFFHVGCIDIWLGSHSTCPLCRVEVKPRLQPQNREGPVFSASIDLCALDDTPALLVGADGGGETSKSNGSNSRLSSFRRILSRERSSKRIQPSSHDDEDGDDVDHDLERQ